MGNTFIGQQLSQPTPITDLLNGQSVATIQVPYILTEADFLRLKGGPPITAATAAMLFSGVVGYAISLGPKITPVFEGGSLLLEPGELRTILGCIALSVVIYGLGLFCPDDKKRTMRKIDEHFKNAQPSSHIIGDVQ